MRLVRDEGGHAASKGKARKAKTPCSTEHIQLLTLMAAPKVPADRETEGSCNHSNTRNDNSGSCRLSLLVRLEVRLEPGAAIA